MGQRRFLLWQLLAAIGLAALAGLLRFWLGPWITHLPADYASETFYAADIRYRTSPTAEWQAFPLTARRVDQTLLVAGQVSLIQGEIHWISEDGTPTYETIGLYGVDHRTRQNVPGYGDHDRVGQFLLPAHLQPITYTLWDPFYQGPRTASFKRVEKVDGLQVYVFDYIVEKVDETAGSEFLPDVPEHYRILSNGSGKLWIEPLSGIVVGFEDQGVSYFVDATTDKQIAMQYVWSDHYTPETREAQLRLARHERLQILIVETWLPAGIIAVALVWLAVGIGRYRKHKTFHPALQ